MAIQKFLFWDQLHTFNAHMSGGVEFNYDNGSAGS